MTKVDVGEVAQVGGYTGLLRNKLQLVFWSISCRLGRRSTGIIQRHPDLLSYWQLLGMIFLASMIQQVFYLLFLLG